MDEQRKKLVLYSHDGKLGDAVVMTGLVDSLSRAGFAVYVTASRGNLRFWQADRRLAGVIEVPKTGLVGKLSALRSLRRVRPDYLFSWDLHRSSTGTLLARLSGARHRVGFCPDAKDVFDVVLSFDPACDHITWKYEQAAALLDVAPPLSVPSLGFSIVAKSLAGLVESPKRVFVNFFGSVPDKSFTAEAIQTVLERLASGFPSVAFLVCYMQPQAWIVDRVVNFANIDAIRTDVDWQDLYGAIQACDAVMTVDTSIAHIATALGKPLLDIFCKDSRARINFYPVGEAVTVIESSSPDVISQIDIDELISSLRGVLALN
jgi:ADP-heptose:LPS heptosyltransferase